MKAGLWIDMGLRPRWRMGWHFSPAMLRGLSPVSFCGWMVGCRCFPADRAFRAQLKTATPAFPLVIEVGMGVALPWLAKTSKRGLFSDPLASARHNFHASATAGKYPPTLGGH